MDSYRRDDLVFDIRDRGPQAGEAVLLLHGFPQDATAWDAVVPALTSAGYRTIAPDQRGYSPGARPRGRGSYRFRELVADVLALLDAAGIARAHVVGHDWGGLVAWAMGAAYRDRVASLAVLSTPHPTAMTRAMTRGQALRSLYVGWFQVPWLPERLLHPAGPGWRLLTTGMPAEHRRAYAARLADPEARVAALAWYRAIPLELARPSVRLGRIRVPTLYVWGDRDPAVGRAAAAGTGSLVTAPYRFEVLRGAGHWLPERSPDRISELLLDHLAANPAGRAPRR